MSWLPYLIVVPVLATIQLSVRHALGPATAIGDEKGYCACGGWLDPYQPVVFLRVPLMAWLSKQCHRLSSRPEALFRTTTGTASMVTILVSMMSAQLYGGDMAAFLIGLLLAMMPGRIILSQNIWPDIWLGMWLSLVCLAMIYPELSPTLRSQVVGVLAALAFITRFDALLLSPFAAYAMAPADAWDYFFILSPTLLIFIGLSMRNSRRYGIPWPDTTWMFNLMIAAGETDNEKASQVLVTREVVKVTVAWKKLDNPDHFSASITSLRHLFTRPVRAFAGMFLRLWASIGPDSFVLHRLLPPLGSAYPEISSRFNRTMKVALVVAFPVFASVTILALLVAKQPVTVVLWPTLAFCVPSLFHNRTRYRQSWLPGAALLLVTAASTSDFWMRLLSVESITQWLVCLGLAVALIRFRVRSDMTGSL